jgi:hypothetical protein
MSKRGEQVSCEVERLPTVPTQEIEQIRRA